MGVFLKNEYPVVGVDPDLTFREAGIHVGLQKTL